MSKEINLSHLIISVMVNLQVCIRRQITHVSLLYKWNVIPLQIHTILRMILSGSLCLVPLIQTIKKNIDVFFQKMLSCLSNISFNIVTCSVICLRTTQPKVNKLKFAYELNNTYLVTWYVYVHNEILILFPRKGFVFLDKDRN